jgi:hypothetical protein
MRSGSSGATLCQRLIFSIVVVVRRSALLHLRVRGRIIIVTSTLPLLLLLGLRLVRSMSLLLLLVIQVVLFSFPFLLRNDINLLSNALRKWLHFVLSQPLRGTEMQRQLQGIGMQRRDNEVFHAVIH